ncbi:L,D-transpeptidase family protein [Latilactobacillus graminis]|uniref:ErfK YbiS YcfS YnhG n=2 Tax=Latilactobacillus graminis TaxID=60519 RepID=A0AA89L1L1_9LACO|nr:L,D-transpeptidase/peptidoglycan binding protein [Latilactobacillus graminis]KRM24467.1 erfK YbiS YcfS YnhG [Latilactobacillus graminis DSM 20719]QFP79075.1 L,D-transpeptidase family protein [Latilactobacillus graminis]
MKLTKKAYVVLGVATIVLIGGYSAVSLHYQNAFLPHTTVAGVSISGQSVVGANEQLLKKVNSQKYTLKDKEQKLLTFTGQDAGFSHNFKPLLQKIKQSQNGWTWLGHLFGKDQTTKSEDALILNANDFDKFSTQTLEKVNANRQSSVDAHINLTDQKFDLVKEIYGNTIDVAQFKKTVAHGINQGQATINLKNDYTQPAVKSTNQQLQKAAKQLKTIANEKISYSVNGNAVQVPKAEIQSWLTYDHGTISLNKAAVTKYVYQLKAKYDTFDKALTFNSTKEGTVTVPAGIYGWSISPADEISALMTEVPKGKDFSRTAVIRGSGIDQKTRSVGSTYIEIDLKAQHMWLYQNGKVTIETDIVSAQPPQVTPTGVWSIWKKERNATLKGKNFDGVSEYASPVNYWMPIDETGVGIHDSPWQPKYGGDWYQHHGSHGCINTPPGTMAKLYNTVSEGIPVVVI